MCACYCRSFLDCRKWNAKLICIASPTYLFMNRENKVNAFRHTCIYLQTISYGEEQVQSVWRIRAKVDIRVAYNRCVRYRRWWQSVFGSAFTDALEKKFFFVENQLFVWIQSQNHSRATQKPPINSTIRTLYHINTRLYTVIVRFFSFFIPIRNNLNNDPSIDCCLFAMTTFFVFCRNFFYP